MLNRRYRPASKRNIYASKMARHGGSHSGWRGDAGAFARIAIIISSRNEIAADYFHAVDATDENGVMSRRQRAAFSLRTVFTKYGYW